MSSYSEQIPQFDTIFEFYNYLKQPNNIPTSHRHFKVFLYPDLTDFYENKVIIKDKQYKNKNSINFFEFIGGNTFFQRFSLAIQSVTMPTNIGFQGGTEDYKSPLGGYTTINSQAYYDSAATNDELTFQIIDQMKPQFENEINQWIYSINLCETPFGYNFPRVNIAIKYYRQIDISNFFNNVNNNKKKLKESIQLNSKEEKDIIEYNKAITNTSIYQAKKIKPNFIYYFRGCFPTKFQSCKIDHKNDNESDFKRKVTFSYNTCWVFGNEFQAKRYNLSYLFSEENLDKPPQHIQKKSEGADIDQLFEKYIQRKQDIDTKYGQLKKQREETEKK